MQIILINLSIDQIANLLTGSVNISLKNWVVFKTSSNICIYTSFLCKRETFKMFSSYLLAINKVVRILERIENSRRPYSLFKDIVFVVYLADISGTCMARGRLTQEEAFQMGFGVKLLAKKGLENSQYYVDLAWFSFVYLQYRIFAIKLFQLL